TAVERELVLRLASLLWRIRRATSIETTLLSIQAEVLRDRKVPADPSPQFRQPTNVLLRVIEPAVSHPSDGLRQREGDASDFAATSAAVVSPARELSHAFQRLVHLDAGVFDRLGRYEAALWRQTVQTLFALRLARRRPHMVQNRGVFSTRPPVVR